MQTSTEKEYADFPPISEERKAVYLEKIRNFTLMDDDFMSKVFEDTACAEYLLQVILDRDDLTVTEVQSQRDMKNLQGRSVRLDILATDDTGRIYNIEVQRSDAGALPQRARYNSSLLDANITNPGDDYKDLYETYVIFITETDVLKANKPIYHADRIIAETGLPLNDGAHIIYVNGQNRDDTKLGRLMQDFHCRSADEMNSAVLAQRSRYFKEDEKGVRTMCRAVEELIMDELHQVAVQMLILGKLTHEEIAQHFKLTLDEVEKLAEQYVR